MINTEHKPHCKHCEWRIVNEREDKDFVCGMFGSGITGYHLCYGDEHCKHYVPDIKEGSENNEKMEPRA